MCSAGRGSRTRASPDLPRLRLTTSRPMYRDDTSRRYEAVAGCATAGERAVNQPARSAAIRRRMWLVTLTVRTRRLGVHVIPLDIPLTPGDPMLLRRPPRSVPRRGGWHRIRRVAVRCVKSSLVSLLLAVAAVAGLVYGSGKVSYPGQAATPEATLYEYADGSAMATEGATHRLLVPISRVPVHVQRAVLAA